MYSPLREWCQIRTFCITDPLNGIFRIFSTLLCTNNSFNSSTSHSLGTESSNQTYKYFAVHDYRSFHFEVYRVAKPWIRPYSNMRAISNFPFYTMFQHNTFLLNASPCEAEVMTQICIHWIPLGMHFALKTWLTNAFGFVMNSQPCLARSVSVPFFSCPRCSRSFKNFNLTFIFYLGHSYYLKN